MNLTDGGKLITVYDIEGNKVGEFGDLIEKNDNKLYQNLENFADILFDDEDNLYCVFGNFPVLRKYKDQNLVFEVSFENLPEIKERLKKWESEHEAKKGMFIYDSKMFISGVSFDEKYIYVMLNGISEKPIYVFNKDTGKIVKKIILENEEDSSFGSFCCNSGKYILVVDKKSMTVLKFEK